MKNPDKIEEAKQLATEAHKDQRYGVKPYMYHVEQVAKLSKPFGEQAHILAYLHDVVEDTEVTIAQISEQFGEQIALSLIVLTDPDIQDRTQRKAVSHKKLSEVDVNSPQRVALIVKTADRLANTQACIDDNRQDKLAKYLNEYPDFRQSAYRPGLCDELWQRLDDITK